MKKIIKWIVLLLVLCGIISLSLCYIIIPERTKCAIDIVVGYLNTPIGLGVGCSSVGGLILFLPIKYGLSYTKYGKGELKKLENRVLDIEKSAKDYASKGEKIESEIKTYLSGYSGEIDYLANCVGKVATTIPNAKVNALGNEILNGYETKKVELEDKVDNYEKYVKEQVNIDELLKRVRALESRAFEYGKREESINDKAEEE